VADEESTAVALHDIGRPITPQSIRSTNGCRINRSRRLSRCRRWLANSGPANLAGNQDAREWMRDVKEITLAIQVEQNQVSALLQALHGFVMRSSPTRSASRSSRQTSS
jgi:hypothetical protein